MRKMSLGNASARNEKHYRTKKNKRMERKEKKGRGETPENSAESRVKSAAFFT